MLRGSRSKKIGKFLCIDIDGLSRPAQLMIMSSCVIVLNLGSAHFVERTFKLPGFKFGWFFSLFELGAISLFSFTMMQSQRLGGVDVTRKCPLHYYALLALFYLLTRGLTNVALTLVDFPTGVIMKSSKIVPVMIGSTIILRKRYSMFDYLCVLVMVVGMVIFTLGDPSLSTRRVSNSVTGIALLFLSLFTGTVVGTGQEFVMRTFGASESEVLLFSSSIGAALDVVYMVASGELRTALSYCNTFPASAVPASGNSTLAQQALGQGTVLGLRSPYLYMCVSGALAAMAIVFIMAIVKHFGATMVTLITSGRKFLTIIISILFFAKPITFSYVLGAFLVLMAGCANVIVKKRARVKSRTPL